MASEDPTASAHLGLNQTISDAPDSHNTSPQSQQIDTPDVTPGETTNGATEPAITLDHENFVEFVKAYFLDPQGQPDRSILNKPIQGTLVNQDCLLAMRSVVKKIPGLVLLRKNAETVLIGWEDALREETLRVFDNRKAYHYHLWNANAWMLNSEPKLFLQRYLGVDYNLNGPPFHVNRDLTSVVINTRKLISQSILSDLREHEPELIIKLHDGVAVVGWNTKMVVGEIGRLMWGASKFSEDIDKDGEAKHLTTYWTNWATFHKAKGGDYHAREYLWACHRAIRAQINQAPGPPLKFEFPKLPGSYIVKIAWKNLKPEFQFQNWDSESPKNRFSCRGREPGKTDMLLHIEPSEANNKENQLKARFNFGLIEGTMVLRFAEQLPKPQGPSSEEPTAAHASDKPGRQKRKRADTPRALRGKYIRLPAEQPVPVYTKEQVPRKLRAVDFQMQYRLTQAALNGDGSHYNILTPRNPTLSVDASDSDGYGQLRYHDGAESIYNGTKGYFVCPLVAEGLQIISIYRVSEGAPLDGF